MTLRIDLEKWRSYVGTLAVEPLFVTVSGSHLYGFPSADSDVDLRGCHQLPLEEVVGLTLPSETFQREVVHDNIEVDIVSHDIGKYFRLLVKNNGYVLEQIFSPIVVQGETFLQRLRPIASRCVTKHHYHHYRGFYGTQRRLLEKQADKSAKQVLYAYRVLLTGIHLLQTGDVESNLRTLNQIHPTSGIDELIAQKTAEKIGLGDLDWQLDQLEARLDSAFASTSLADQRDTEAVNDLLVSLRLESRRVDPTRKQDSP